MGLIGSAVGAVGSIFGGIMASKAMRKMRGRIEEQGRKNQNWYDRRYNEDATQRADAQRLLTMTEERIKQRNKQAQGVQAVMGGTEEGVAITQAENANALADTMSNIAVNAEQRKGAIEGQYMARDAQISEAQNNLDVKKAQNIAQATQAVTKLASDLPF